MAPNKSASVLGQYIHDNILLSHEIMHGYHENKVGNICAVKVDLRKVYDTVREGCRVCIE